MDEVVRAAMQKWPNVPDVYGWLSLTARGDWRLRGAPIGHTTLRDFLQRNYQADEYGRWYFQNGPQRVFVRCQAAPLVARLIDGGLLLHTGEATTPSAVYLDQHGSVWFATPRGAASLDDRELACWLESLQSEGGLCSDEVLLDWCAAPVFDLFWRGLRLGSLLNPSVELGFCANPKPLRQG